MKKVDYLNTQNEVLTNSIETRKNTLENLSADSFDSVAEFEKARDVAQKRLNEQVELKALLNDEKIQNVLFKFKFDMSKFTFAKYYDTREFKLRFAAFVKALAYDNADHLRKYDDYFLRTVSKDLSAKKALKYSRRKVHNEMRHKHDAKQTTQSNYFANFVRELSIAKDDRLSIEFDNESALFKAIMNLYA